MDIVAQVLTPWIGDGTTASPYRPQLGDDYALQSWSDVTGQSPVPPPTNLFIVEILTDEQTINAISADAQYSVLWAEPVTPGELAG